MHITTAVYSGTGNFVLHYKFPIGSPKKFGDLCEEDKEINVVNIVLRQVSQRNVSQEVKEIFNVGKKQSLICDALRDLVTFVQCKKREKHPWRSVNFSKVLIFVQMLPDRATHHIFL